MSFKTLVGQQLNLNDSTFIRLLDINPRSYQNHDTVWIYSGICKTLKTTVLIGKNAGPFLNQFSNQQTTFLKVHGNIQYDFTYRSLVDTPFSQKDFTQHTVQTTLDLTVKEKYPVKVTILTRQSNSPYFEDITDVNVQFNQRLFLQALRNNLLKFHYPS